MIFRPGVIPLFAQRSSMVRSQYRQMGSRSLVKQQAIRAAVMAALYSTASLADTAADSDSDGLQEVIVTASHHEVSARDLPISITAVTGDELSKQGIQDVAGLAHSVAGVNFTDKGPFSGAAGANLI